MEQHRVRQAHWGIPGDGSKAGLLDASEIRSATFLSVARHLLGSLFDLIPAERGYLLCRSAPRGHDPATASLETILAIDRNLAALPKQEGQLDTQQIIELSGLDGARVGPRTAEAAARPLLTCSFALPQGARGILALEGMRGGSSFSPNAGRTTEEVVCGHLPALYWLHSLESQTRELELLRSEGEELERQLEEHAPDGAGFSTAALAGLDASGRVEYEGVITRSPAVLELFKIIDRIKDTELSVLIIGETGTGKELFAKAIHKSGKRASKPFEIVACASLAPNLIESELFGYRRGAFSGADADRKGAFERANGGTLFLDGIADMPVEMQKKLLRVLQEKVIRPIGSEDLVAVDVRIIASAQHDLTQAVKRKEFRDDLFHRLDGITFHIPPLRERREDIALLIAHFLGELARQEGVSKHFSESALRELHLYSWPGNVQELRNLVTRAFLTSNRRVISRHVILPLLSKHAAGLYTGEGLVQEGDHLVLSIPYSAGFNELISECEKLILLSALRRNRGNKSRVTQQLRIPRQTLYNKLEKHGIAESDYMDFEKA